MAFLTLLVTFIVTFIYHQTSDAEPSDVTQYIPVSVQEGGLVELLIKTPSQPKELEWIKDSYVEVSYNKEQKYACIHINFMGRVDFNSKTFTLTLKNVWKNDSGIYKAKAIYQQSEKIIGQYNVSVLGAASHGSISKSIPHPWIIFLFLILIMIF